MSNHKSLTDLHILINKLFKIWLFSFFLYALGIVCHCYFAFNELPGKVVLLGIMVVCVCVFVPDMYLRNHLKTDLSKMLLESASEHHKDIEFLKKILTNSISVFVIAFLAYALFEWVFKVREYIPYSVIFWADLPWRIVFFIKFKKFKTLCRP